MTNEPGPIDKDRLYVTVFKDDDEAAGIWEKQEGVARRSNLSIRRERQFLVDGRNGPCGPCSEIFSILAGKIAGRDEFARVGCDCDRYMEIWNLVFMQFDRSADGKLTPLPKPSIDTGAGLERVASVIQGVDSNYDTDLFQSPIGSIAELAKVKYTMGSNDKTSTSFVWWPIYPRDQFLDRRRCAAF